MENLEGNLYKSPNVDGIYDIEYKLQTNSNLKEKNEKEIDFNKETNKEKNKETNGNNNQLNKKDINQVEEKENSESQNILKKGKQEKINSN